MSNHIEHARGVDVSVYRGHINWNKVINETDIVFGIAKATQGIFSIDETFDTNWVGMRKVNLIRGAYHFFEPKAYAIAQANHYLKVVGDILDTTDLPPIVDVEDYPLWVREAWRSISVHTRIERIQQWLDRVESVTGRVPMIYTSWSSWQAITDDSQAFSRYPLWVANYGVSSPAMPAGNWGGRGWFLWQFTEHGEISGINPPTDINWYRNSHESLKSFLGITSEREAAPVVTNSEMLAALRATAEQHGTDLNELLEDTGLRYIAEAHNHNRPYDGPGVGDLTLSDFEKQTLIQVLEDLETQAPEGIPAGFTNQDMINIFYIAAQGLVIDGYTLLSKAGLAWLADNRGALYTGPTVDDMALNEDEKNAVKVALGIIEPAPIPVPPTPTYPGRTNQDIINLFFRAAAPFTDEPWEWVVQAGLEHMATPTENRQLPYTGPRFEDLPNLSQAEINALLAQL
jgi:GH25 family lysozyme M1 (1,4-beta-N-acetylmuramidase)